VLNKIEDIYEYKKAHEALTYDTLDDLEDIDFELGSGVEHDGKEVLHSNLERVDNKRNKKKVAAYRQNEIKEGSKAGNFFSVKPIDGYIKYDIEFDNLLDTNDFGLTYNDEDAPTKKLAAVWFPNKDFSEMAQNLGADELKLINRAISEKARKMGYDGIKYGDIIIQGL
jgi:hypothetical protein